MNFTYLKKVTLFMALLFLLGGCAVTVREGGYYRPYPYHHYYYYGYWR